MTALTNSIAGFKVYPYYSMISTVQSFSYFSDVASPEIEGLASIVIRIRIERLRRRHSLQWPQTALTSSAPERLPAQQRLDGATDAFVPIDSSLQTVLERNLSTKSKEPLRFAHIERTPWLPVRFRWVPKDGAAEPGEAGNK